LIRKEFPKVSSLGGFGFDVREEAAPVGKKITQTQTWPYHKQNLTSQLTNRPTKRVRGETTKKSRFIIQHFSNFCSVLLEEKLQ
jgi:hypothetical protein